jgi:hypothetical protein
MGQFFARATRVQQHMSQLRTKTFLDVSIWPSAMKFETILTKKIIRRISPRYFGLLRNHFELIFESVKASDEIDIRHNSDVVQLAVSLSKGKLPG